LPIQLLVVLLGVVIGWISKGKIASIVSVKLKRLWMLPVSYLFQYLSIHIFKGTVYELFLVFSYVILLYFCFENRKIQGLWLTFWGTFLNFVVLAANGLRMPAYLPPIQRLAPSIIPALIHGDIGKSIAMSSHTLLNPLGDIFFLNLYPPTLISIGDIIFSIGLIIFIRHAMLLERQEQSDVQQSNLA